MFFKCCIMFITLILYCIKVGVEIRKSLCYFIEKNCINIIHLYENDGPKKVCFLINKLLLNIY